MEYFLGPILDFGINLREDTKIIGEFRCQDEKFPVYSQSVDFFVFSETTVSRQKMSMLKAFVLLSCRHSMLVIINFKQIHVCIFHFYPRQRPILKGFATNGC